MLGYVVTAFAVIALFTVQKWPAITFAVWTCTNGVLDVGEPCRGK